MESLHPYGKRLSILILDYCRAKQGATLLGSLKYYLKADAEIVYLVNGAQTPEEYEYAFKFYSEGYIDKLIVNKTGNGAGYGHIDLLNQCNTPYFLLLQVDQVLLHPLNEEIISKFIELLENDYHLVDLADDQSNKGIYSDRGHMGKTDFFNSLNLAQNAGGGPGPFQSSKRWNENYLQEVFTKNNYKIAHINPKFIGDNGKISLRHLDGGGQIMHYTDQKKLWVLKTPTKRDPFYDLTDNEWDEVLSGNWPKEGKIPENYLNSSFKCWEE